MRNEIKVFKKMIQSYKKYLKKFYLFYYYFILCVTLSTTKTPKQATLNDLIIMNYTIFHTNKTLFDFSDMICFFILYLRCNIVIYWMAFNKITLQHYICFFNLMIKKF